jgi:hypothetical protein
MAPEDSYHAGMRGLQDRFDARRLTETRAGGRRLS